MNKFNLIPQKKGFFKDLSLKSKILYIIQWIGFCFISLFLFCCITLIIVCPYIVNREKTTASADVSDIESNYFPPLYSCYSWLDVNNTVAYISNTYLTASSKSAGLNVSGTYIGPYRRGNGGVVNGSFSFNSIAVAFPYYTNYYFIILLAETWNLSNGGSDITRFDGHDYLILGTDSYNYKHSSSVEIFYQTPGEFSIVLQYPFPNFVTGNDLERYFRLNPSYKFTSSDVQDYFKDLGHNTGYDSGYLSGYDEGFSAGYSSGSGGQFNPITFVLEPVNQFMNLKLFGNFSIGNFLAIGLFVSLALIFLKIFAGG